MVVCSKSIMVLIGILLIKLPLSPLSYYGNLLPYLASYYYARRDEIFVSVDPLWPFSIYRCTFTLTMIFTSPLELRFGIRPCIVAGLLLLWTSIMCCFIAVQEPLAFVFLFGVTHGIAVGILYPTTLKMSLQTFPNKAGLVTGLLSSGPVLGSLANIGMAFFVINPNNAKPDLYVDKTVLFSDPSIIHRVPYFFLIAGSVMIAYTAVGMTLALVGSSSSTDHSTEQTCEETSSSYTKLTKHNEHSTHKGFDHNEKCASPVVMGIYRNFKRLCNFANHKCKKSKYETILSLSDGDVTSNKENQTCDQPQCVDESTKCVDESTKCVDKSTKCVDESTKCVDESTKCVVLAELSPREALRTGKFWCVWVCYLCTTHTAYLHMNLYKQYGQLVIPTDSVLVAAGMLGMVGTLLARPCIGLFSDKFGIRKTTLAISVLSSIFMCMMVISHNRRSWVYAILVVIEFVCISPQTMVFSLLTMFEFGKTHCASNFGLASSGNLVIMLLEPFIASITVDALGWDWLFLTGAIAAAVSMVSILVVIYRW